MVYPDDFVTAVKAEFPNWKEVHRHLDEGDSVVGRSLRDSSYPVGLSGKQVVEKLESGHTLTEVKEEIAQMDALNKRRKELYDWWVRIEDGHFPIRIRIR